MTNKPDTISEERLGEMLAGLDGVTPGPWEAQGTEWEGEERGANFIVGSRQQGLIGAAHAWPTEFASGDFDRVDANATHIARCDPDTMREVLPLALEGLAARSGGVMKVNGPISLDDFGAKLRGALTDRGVTLRDLAASIGVDKSSASRACQGKSVSMEHFVPLWNWLHPYPEQGKVAPPLSTIEPVTTEGEARWREAYERLINWLLKYPKFTLGDLGQLERDIGPFVREPGPHPTIAVPVSPSVEQGVTDEQVERALLAQPFGLATVGELLQFGRGTPNPAAAIRSALEAALSNGAQP